MLDTSFLTIEERELFEEFYAKIDLHFNNEIVDIELPIGQLDSFKGCDIRYQQSIRINEGAGNAYVPIIEFNFQRPAGKRWERFKEFQVWAFARLPKDFGHLIIRLETLRDRIGEYFQPLELDFPDDKDFCKRFYVLAKDEKKAKSLFTSSFRELLKQLKVRTFQMEIKDDFIIIGDEKHLGNDEGVALAAFAYNLSELRF